MRMNRKIPHTVLAVLTFFSPICHGEIRVVTERNDDGAAFAAFKFKNVTSPSKADAAEKAKFTLVDGQRDGNGGELSALHTGGGRARRISRRRTHQLQRRLVPARS